MRQNGTRLTPADKCYWNNHIHMSNFLDDRNKLSLFRFPFALLLAKLKIIFPFLLAYETERNAINPS